MHLIKRVLEEYGSQSQDAPAMARDSADDYADRDIISLTHLPAGIRRVWSLNVTWLLFCMVVKFGLSQHICLSDCQ